MSRSRLVLLGLCAVVVSLMGFAGSAHAADWLVLTSGGLVKTAAELNASVASEVETKGSILSMLSGIATKVKCAVLNVTNVITIGSETR